MAICPQSLTCSFWYGAVTGQEQPGAGDSGNDRPFWREAQRPAFYQMMSRLERDGLVEGRYESIVIGDQSVKERDTGSRRRAPGHGHEPANFYAAAGWADRGRPRVVRCVTESGWEDGPPASGRSPARVFSLRAKDLRTNGCAEAGGFPGLSHPCVLLVMELRRLHALQHPAPDPPTRGRVKFAGSCPCPGARRRDPVSALFHALIADHDRFVPPLHQPVPFQPGHHLVEGRPAALTPKRPIISRIARPGCSWPVTAPNTRNCK